MAKFTFQPKQAQTQAHSKELPHMKKTFNYRGYLYRGYLVVVLALLAYIAVKVT